MAPTMRPVLPEALAHACAQDAYAHAREQLLAAEVAYARALLALWRAQGGDCGAAPRERHFLCGHGAMARVTAEGGEVRSLCPACARPHAADEDGYIEPRRLLVRRPRRGDPD